MALQKYIKEPFPAISHFFGVALSVAGFVALLELSESNGKVLVASLVYGSSLVLLYLASTLNHGVHCSMRTALRLERLDNAAIFLLIAGTYTPVCLLTIKGGLGLVMLSAEWLLAIVGIISVFWREDRSRKGRVVIYLGMGWLCLAAIGPIIASFPPSLLPWLIAGGVCYSVGAVIFLIDWPPLWKGLFSAHDFWHVLVLSGSTCHFVMIAHIVNFSAVSSM